jgi:uncharacterized protein YceK
MMKKFLVVSVLIAAFMSGCGKTVDKNASDANKSVSEANKTVDGNVSEANSTK